MIGPLSRGVKVGAAAGLEALRRRKQGREKALVISLLAAQPSPHTFVLTDDRVLTPLRQKLTSKFSWLLSWPSPPSRRMGVSSRPPSTTREAWVSLSSRGLSRLPHQGLTCSDTSVPVLGISASGVAGEAPSSDTPQLVCHKIF